MTCQHRREECPAILRVCARQQPRRTGRAEAGSNRKNRYCSSQKSQLLWCAPSSIIGSRMMYPDRRMHLAEPFRAGGECGAFSGKEKITSSICHVAAFTFLNQLSFIPDLLKLPGAAHDMSFSIVARLCGSRIIADNAALFYAARASACFSQ